MDDRSVQISKQVFLVYIIEDVEAGRAYPRHDWPLHISLVPWFVTAKRSELDQMLHDFLVATEPFTVTVGGEDLFGESHRVKVNVIDESTSLQNLHEALLDRVESIGTIIADKEYLRENYRGHITHYFERYKAPGEQFIIDHLYLAELTDDDHCTPLKRYEFGKEQ